MNRRQKRQLKMAFRKFWKKAEIFVMMAGLALCIFLAIERYVLIAFLVWLIFIMGTIISEQEKELEKNRKRRGRAEMVD